MATDLSEIKTRLWEPADQLHANSEFQASEDSQPVLGLICLCFAEECFAKAEAEIGSGSARNPTSPDGYKANGVLINQLGRSVLRRLRVIEGHEVCRIDVPAPSSPTWHDHGNDDSILWERLPNSTRKVTRGEVDDFLKDRFAREGSCL